MNMAAFTTATETIRGVRAARPSSNQAQESHSNVTNRFERFEQLVTDMADGADSALEYIGASEDVKAGVQSTATLILSGVDGIRATKDLMAEVKNYRTLRTKQRGSAATDVSERLRLEAQRNILDSRAKIAESTLEIFAASTSARTAATDLGEAVGKVLATPKGMTASAAVLSTTGLGGVLAATAPVVIGALTAAAPALVVASAAFFIAKLAATLIKRKAERESKSISERIDALGHPNGSPSSLQDSSGTHTTNSGADPPSTPEQTSPVSGGEPNNKAAGSPATTITPRSTNMINTDPETMRTVSAALKTFSEDIDAAKQALQQAVSGASDSWGDDVFEHTESTVEEILSKIAPGEDCSELANHIDTKASALEEYNS